jgi:hypothetical protein
MLLKNNIDLYNLITSLAGVNAFTAKEKTYLLNFANKRLNTAYNMSPSWNRYVEVSEKRKLSSFELSGITGTLLTGFNSLYYSIGDDSLGSRVYALINGGTNNNYYVFKDTGTGKWNVAQGTETINTLTDVVEIGNVTTNTTVCTSNDVDADGNNVVASSPLDVKNWAFSTGTLGGSGNVIFTAKTVVPYEQTIKRSTLASNKINQYIRVHKDNAFLKQSSTEYDFFVDSLGANVINARTDTDEVFVTYKKHIINTDASSTGYGLVFESFDSGQDIPLEFFNYTAHGVYADFLRMDGQHGKADNEDNKAEMFLINELERIDIINNNNSLNHKFTNYLNTQSR